MEPDDIICNILKEFMELDESRVVVYNQGFNAPNDDAIYIVVSYEDGTIIGNTHSFDDVNEQYVYKTVTAGKYTIELTSRDRSALTRKEEVIMALGSYIASQYEQDENVSIYRPNNILDLSFVEESSSLHRFQISGIIHSIKTVRKDVNVYDKFRTQEVLN